MSERADWNDHAASESPNEAPKLPFCVVGIGASAGGLEALEQLFDNMPVDLGCAYVVVQHLSPDFKSLMDELLSRRTKMPVRRVDGATDLEPNSIYLIPPKKNIVLEEQQLKLIEPDSAGAINLPIDIFFRSMARTAGHQGIAVVLSGTGSDGSKAIKDVHEAGGLVIVQRAESASFDGMPRNAIATGIADVVTEPRDIPKRIQQYISDPHGFPRGVLDHPDDSGDERTRIFRLFRERFGIDFSLYKSATVNRRLERRILLSHAGDLSSYLETLERDPKEIDSLYRDLLVEVTHFFRDGEAFDVVRQVAIPQIVRNSTQSGEIRVWVPGCATGEEAYTLAMLFDYCIQEHQRNVELKVFASDVHHQSLEAAATGIYSAESIQRVPDYLRARYFQPMGDSHQVAQELRKMVIFAHHDLTHDPPFTRIDFVSCRNVLIYLEPVVQRRVLASFHFGMKTGATLFLGPS